ncbi:hypothetical protein [Streptomyces sp. NPDC049879]|uniref:hypothetical protein n=1 Tax=Streptomyces sp. NPDC049879 TaxID=3365598 RepID=UPI003792A1EC
MSDRSDPAPDTAVLEDRRRRFLVIHRDADDVLGWREAGGAVALDDGRAAACVHALVEDLGGVRRASVVWARDEPPARCCAETGHPVP